MVFSRYFSLSVHNMHVFRIQCISDNNENNIIQRKMLNFLLFGICYSRRTAAIRPFLIRFVGRDVLIGVVHADTSGLV